MNYEERYFIINSITPYYKKRYLGKGCSGVCYLTEDNKVFKEMKNDKLDFYHLKKFTNVKNDSIVFPNEIVYQYEHNDNNIIGYTMDYIDGYLFREIEDNESINNIISASIKVEENIKKLSYQYSIMMEEINPSNVIYSKDKKFKIIDTDFYTYFPSEEEQIIYKNNIYEWGNYMMSMLGGCYPFIDEDLNNLYCDCVCNGRVKPSQIVIKIKDLIEKISNQNINTLGEYQNSLKLVKK